MLQRDEIIEMVNQVGCKSYTPPPTRAVDGVSMTFAQLEAFAELVAEKAFKDGYAIGEAAGFKEGVKLERKAWCEA